MEKVFFKYPEGKIYIKYLNNTTNLNEYIDMTFYNPLEVIFIPDIIITETQSLNFLNNIREEIIQKLDDLIEKYNEFYKHFEINYLNFHMTEELVHEITNHKTTGKCVMIINCTPKEINSIKNNI